MEKALWYLLAGTRGGENRVRIIRLIDDRPRNANQIAGQLDVDYNTVRHHLDMLLDHDVVERSGDEYGALYFLTDRFERHRDQFEEITERVALEPTEETGGSADGVGTDTTSDAETTPDTNPDTED